MRNFLIISKYNYLNCKNYKNKIEKKMKKLNLNGEYFQTHKFKYYGVEDDINEEMCIVNTNDEQIPAILRGTKVYPLNFDEGLNGFCKGADFIDQINLFLVKNDLAPIGVRSSLIGYILHTTPWLNQFIGISIQEDSGNNVWGESYTFWRVKPVFWADSRYSLEIFTSIDTAMAAANREEKTRIKSFLEERERETEGVYPYYKSGSNTEPAPEGYHYYWGRREPLE